MKSFLVILLICLNSFLVAAQNQEKKLDSMFTALKAAKNDTAKLLPLNELSNYYGESNWDSALLFSNQGLQLSGQLKQPLWVASFLLGNSYFLSRKGNLPEAFKLANEALIIAQDDANEKNVFIPSTDRYVGSPHKYRLYQLAGAYHILGNEMIDDDKAIMYYKEEIRISQQIGAEDNLVNSNMNIGNIFMYQGKFDSALIYYFRGIHYSEKTGEKTYEGIILEHIGSIYLKSNQIDSAKHYYRLSIQVNKQQNNITGLAYAYTSLADLSKKTGNPDSSLFYAGKHMY